MESWFLDHWAFLVVLVIGIVVGIGLLTAFIRGLMQGAAAVAFQEGRAVGHAERERDHRQARLREEQDARVLNYDD